LSPRVQSAGLTLEGGSSFRRRENDASETALHSEVLKLYVAGQLGNRIGSPQSKPALRYNRSIRTVDMKTRTKNTRGPRGLTASVILAVLFSVMM
jgi:hypothetical protein